MNIKIPKLLNINIYILNLALLITHEIDSAFWKEWNLFGLPGDIQGFLIANFLLAAVALYGLKQLIIDKTNGFFFAFLLSAAGLLTFGIHMYFILTGYQEFTSLISIAILSLIFIVSLMQGILAILTLYRKS